VNNTPINDGGPAFPMGYHPEGNNADHFGMTLRQYAAIKLRVPESGTDWLDDMIRKSNRDYFAAAALQGNLAGQSVDVGYYEGKDAWNKAAEDAYAVADAMLKAREAK
jgi:hypothetical protein